MSLLGSHSLAEFVPYSLGAWHALLAQYNAALWPAQPAVFAASLVLLWRIAQPATSETPTAARLSAAVLALAWAVIGWAFMVERFMSLNWVAGYFGIAFLTQAMLLALFGAVRLRLRPGGVPALRTLGALVLGYAIIVQPLVEPLLWGRPWMASELFGIGPTPTAIGTIGWALTRTGPVGWLLLPVPVLWLAFIGVSGLGIDA